MSKPAFGTGINTSDSAGLATNLANAWGILEANESSGTLVDSKGGDTATLRSGQSVSSQTLLTSSNTSGATLATAIACALAHGYPVPAAVEFAKAWVTECLRAAYPLGHGHGPVSAMFRLRKSP